MRRLALILAPLAAVVLTACGGSNDEPASDDTPFAYDAAAPLGYDDRGVVNHGYPIAVHDVSFEGPRGKVDGFLAVPPGKGPFPAVVYLHGTGGDRTQLLVPATWMAARGVVALTITSPAAAADGSTPEERLAAQRRGAVDEVVTARRAVDALGALPEVDDARLGFVGWSEGARVGAILAGVEPRIRAFDLFSGGSPPLSAYTARAPESLRPAIRRELGAVDPLRWIAQARADTVLLQDGRRDEVVPRAALDALAKAAGKAAEVRWYDQGHAPGDAAYADQLDGLADRLGVAGPVVKGARAGP